MLPTFIQKYVKKKPTKIQKKTTHFIFDPVQKRETNLNFTGCQMPHLMIVLILCINLLNFT